MNPELEKLLWSRCHQAMYWVEARSRRIDLVDIEIVFEIRGGIENIVYTAAEGLIWDRYHEL